MVPAATAWTGWCGPKGLTESEALNVIADWTGNGGSVPAPDREQKIEYALSHWQKAVPIAGTIAERYLSETRGIDIGRLPADASKSSALPSQLRLRSGALALSARADA